MKAYIYDTENYFVGETSLQPSPLEPGVFFEMPSTTTVVPPQLEANQVARWNGSSWQTVPDYSGKKYYSKIDKSEKFFVRGEQPEDLNNYTEISPLNIAFEKWHEASQSWKKDSKAEKQNEIKIRQSQIRNLLLATDYIELPNFLERKGQAAYTAMMSYRADLRECYHDVGLPIPEVPQI